jgi:hypothetical protein
MIGGRMERGLHLHTATAQACIANGTSVTNGSPISWRGRLGAFHWLCQDQYVLADGAHDIQTAERPRLGRPTCPLKCQPPYPQPRANQRRTTAIAPIRALPMRGTGEASVAPPDAGFGADSAHNGRLMDGCQPAPKSDLPDGWRGSIASEPPEDQPPGEILLVDSCG